MIIDRLRVFNIREWRRHPGRTVLSFTVVAISAMLLVAVFGIAGSITGSADRFVAGIGGNANLEVSGVTDTGLPEAVRVDVAKVPGWPRPYPCCERPSGRPPNASSCSAWTRASMPCRAICSERYRIRSARWQQDRALSRSASRPDMRWVIPLL